MNMTNNELRHEWENRITDLLSSDQSIPAWSIANNLKIHQVRYWLCKLKTKSQPDVDSTPQWLSVKIGNPKSEHSANLCIKVGAATIEVQPGFDPELLLDVVRALSATC
jgi:hypothetical protein